MARMLGRVHVRSLSPNCAMRDGRYCRDCGWDGSLGTRAAKRLEARGLAAEIDGELHPLPDLEHLATLGLLYDPSDCEHGCCGSPSCGERCTFVCHSSMMD